MNEHIHIDDPLQVLKEVKVIVALMFPAYDFTKLEKVFNDTVKLFNGEYPGYQACNTQYHNLKHTTDVVLAMGRLLHGAGLEDHRLDERTVTLGLVAALMHDVGFIQTEDDVTGTGAKYTATHVERSIDFMRTYLAQDNYPAAEVEACACIIKGTCLNSDFRGIPFPSEEMTLVGKLLATADLLGQMADRAYLEKLLFLYYEFREGNVGGYEKELDILQKSMEFYKTTQKRLSQELSDVYTYMRAHFKNRWQIDQDLYQESIQRNIDYLNGILTNNKERYRDYLRRDGIIYMLPEAKGEGEGDPG
jgi:hypothetical protein